MTAGDVIRDCDETAPIIVDYSQKMKWVGQLEAQIYNEVILTHEGAGDVSFRPYDDTTSPETVLLAPAAFSAMYVRWLRMQFALLNADTARYNNEAALFAADYSTFADFYNRTHLPLSPAGQMLKY